MLLCPPAGEDSEYILFMVLFLCQLPADIQDHLAHSTTLTIRLLAEQGDAYFALSGTQLNQPSALVCNINVAAIDRTCQKFSTKNDTRLCFYHAQYETDAKRCTQNNYAMAHVPLVKYHQRKMPTTSSRGSWRHKLKAFSYPGKSFGTIFFH